MPYFILAIAVILGVILILRGLANADPKMLVRVLKWGGIAAGGLGLLYIAMTGRLGLVTGLAAALLPVFLRWRAIGRLAKGFRGPTAGQSSDIETRFLRMRLDHDTGTLSGTVLDGRFRGERLEDLSLSDLLALLQEARVGDEQSAQVLESYLDRIHPDWRAAGPGAGGGDYAEPGSGAGAGSGPRPPPGGMSVDEAYEILGLSRGAGRDAIKEAHRRLMLKNHPDQGGSTYLAAKINQAKDLLLGS